jgi:hypothetical protein
MLAVQALGQRPVLTAPHAPTLALGKRLLGTGDRGARAQRARHTAWARAGRARTGRALPECTPACTARMPSNEGQLALCVKVTVACARAFVRYLQV